MPPALGAPWRARGVNSKWSEWSGPQYKSDMARLRTNRVCFTLNNYEQEDVDKFVEYSTREDVKYLIVGEEVGENGTPHLQGFIHLDADRKKCGLKFWKEELPGGKRAHFEAARGTDEQNSKYCTKSGPYLEVGKPSVPESLWGRVFEAAKQSLEEALAIDPEIAVKHYHQLKSIYDDHNHPQMTSELPELREWQKKAVEMLETQTERQVLFIVDEEGGKGKSALTKHLMTTKKTWACQGGKINDLMYAFDTTAEYAIFDMARCNNPDFYPWNFIENIKSGWFCATKYKGGLKMFNPPKVCVMMNHMPPRDKLSEDRYNVYII